MLALLLLPALVVPAAAVEDVTPARAEGPNRFATAAAVAGVAYPAGTTRAVIATSVAAADALAATPLSGALDAALLLTRPDDLPVETAQALDALGVLEVTLIGGSDVISPEVSATLQQDYDVARIQGQDVWDTAVNVADQVVAAGGPAVTSRGTTAFLANGTRFADALAASAAAHAANIPVLYTTTTELRSEPAGFLQARGIDHVVLLGGESVLSAQVEAALQQRGHTTTRLWGPSRVETAIAVADYSAAELGFDLTTAILTRGDDFPDAVTSGQLGGTAPAPVLLSATPTVLPASAVNWFAEHCPTLEVVQGVGGEAALSVEVLETAEQAAESCAADPPTIPEPQDGQTYVVTPQEALEVESGQARELEVIGRSDDQAFRGPIDIVLFPCANADVTGAGPDTFADDDGDGGADGFASTDTGFARIALVNGNDIDDTAVVVGAAPDPESGVLTFTLFSSEQDCTVPVVIDGNGNGQFDVDADGRPLEPYGLGQVTWRAG